MEENKYLAYFTNHSRMTDLRDQAFCLMNSSDEISDLVQLTQNLLIHANIAEWVYDIKPTDERLREKQFRRVSDRLVRYYELDDSPLEAARSYENRVFGTCRDFAVVLASFLRQKGIPARARCGFASYFLKPFEDHWITEYWHHAEERWVMVDPQIDELQRKKMNVGVNTLDLGAGDFAAGAEAWLMCRTGEADPNDFGIFDMKGLWFVRGNLVRDFASLNKNEMLPWDIWGLIAGEDDDLSEDDYQLLDNIARLMLSEKETLDKIQALYAAESRVKVPQIIKTYIEGSMQTVRLQM